MKFSEETMFQQRLRFLEREPISNKNPTTGTVIILTGDESDPPFYDSTSNIVNLAQYRHRRANK